MATAASSIGIMDPAFFVGKNVLIAWVNDFLKAGIKKVEDMATGAYHCQILDAIYPGKVPLGKVNFNAKYDYEYVKNFKVLQDVFIQNEVIKHVDVEKLVKAKYQDNLEFFQWMKYFFDKFYGGHPYDAVERRKQAMAQFKMGHKHAAATEQKIPVASGIKPLSRSAAAATKPAAKLAAPAKKPAPGVTTKTEDRSAEIEELNSKLAKLRTTIEGLEKERNFYFGKLRQIEVLCQQDEAKEPETKALVLKILYQTDNDEDFQAPAAEEGAAATQEVVASEGEIDVAVGPGADGELLGGAEGDLAGGV